MFPTPVRPPIRAVLALGLLLILGLGVLLAPSAGAEDRTSGSVDGATAIGDLPVTLGQRGPVAAVDGWVESGPVVPLMLLATASMLAAGSAMLWHRCRTVSATGRSATARS